MAEKGEAVNLKKKKINLSFENALKKRSGWQAIWEKWKNAIFYSEFESMWPDVCMYINKRIDQ